MISFRFLISVGIIFVTLEIIAQTSPFIVGKQVHQKYLYSRRQCKQDCANKGKMLTWMSNGRGARGDLYHGQPIQIALFGSSTSICVLLDHEESFSQQIKARLGSSKVHVDNYARDGAAQNEAKTILRGLGDMDKKYEIIIVMLHIEKKREVTEASAFHYWEQWVSKKSLIKSPSLLRRRLKEQVKSEPRLNTLDRILQDKFLNPDKDRNLSTEQARSLRQSGKVKFLDMPLSLSNEVINRAREETKTLLEEAKKVAGRVYLLTQPIAYDPAEHPGVADRWRKLPLIEKGQDHFYSNKSIAENVRKRNEIMTEVAYSMNVEVLDLDGYMRKMLRERDDLFDDKWHFTPAGAEVAADFVAKKIAPGI